MNKLVLGVLGFAILMGSIVVSGKQWKKIEAQNSSIEKQKSEIEYLNENLNLQVKENEALEEENFMLEEHSGILRDSVLRMQKKLVGYRKKDSKQRRYIALVDKKLAEMNDAYGKIRNQMAAQLKKEDADQKEIQNLLAKQAELLAEMEAFKNKKKWAKGNVAKPIKFIENSNEVTPVIEGTLDQSMIGTKVEVLNIQLKKKLFGKNLKRVKKGNDWKYSILKIDITHPQSAILMDKNFKLKIVDLDKDEVLSYVESNPNFPNSSLDSKGIGFNYEGKPIELTYYNKDQKESKNFALQFLFIDNAGKEHIIPGASRQIVKNGKVL